MSRILRPFGVTGGVSTLGRSRRPASSTRRGSRAAGRLSARAQGRLHHRGQTTTCGSKILDGWGLRYDANGTRKLRDAGVVILDKTKLDEFAMGVACASSLDQSGPCARTVLDAALLHEAISGYDPMELVQHRPTTGSTGSAPPSNRPA
ncbi:MAG TPA: amidase family protein [Jiangellaceae bacterium]|nr:amidase family protein [Jiangellaceae bacterium]